MSDSVTGNLPWRPGGIIEHCSPSVGRGPADKVPPRVRFPPLSKSAFFPPSSSPPLALISWSVSVLCFSNFSKSIACKMCRRYLNIQNGSCKIFLCIYLVPCPMSQYLPPSASLPFPVHHTEDRSQPSLIRRLGRLATKISWLVSTNKTLFWYVIWQHLTAPIILEEVTCTWRREKYSRQTRQVTVTTSARTVR